MPDHEYLLLVVIVVHRPVHPDRDTQSNRLSIFFCSYHLQEDVEEFALQLVFGGVGTHHPQICDSY